jgi:hypothetical protein
MSNTMNVLDEAKKIGADVVGFLTAIVKGAATLQTIWSKLSGPVLAASAAVFYDVVKCLAAAESAAASAESGNVMTTITLSETTIDLVKTVINDFKSGVVTITADFNALGIKL